MKSVTRIPLLVGTMALAATTMGGCIYSSEKERVVQSPPAPTTVIAQAPADRVVTYPEGRWTLYGDGALTSEQSTHPSLSRRKHPCGTDR